MLTLYQFDGSPFSWKVRIALAEKRVEYRPIVPANRETDPAFQKLTPIGKVPVLTLEDGTAIFESTVINEFLEERYPSPPLLPNDPADRARARMLEDLADSYLYPALRTIFAAGYRRESGKVYRLRTPDAAKAAEGLRAAAPLLDYLNGELDGQDFLVGDFSLADIGLVPPLLRTGGILDLPLAGKWPHIAAWRARMLERASVKSTAPPPYEILDEPAAGT